MRKYNSTTGLILSFFLGLMSFIPRGFRPGYEPSAENFLISFLYAFCSWIIIQVIIHRYPEKSYVSRAWYSITICMLLSVILYYSAQPLVEKLPILSHEYMPQRRKVVAMLFRGLLFGSFLYFIAYLLALTAEVQNKKLEMEKMAQENLRARLSSLQQQISPHFLFNSLNTLKSIAPDKTTKKFVQQLSDVYRYLLNKQNNHFTILKDELAFVNAYLHIMKERFEDALEIIIEIDEHLIEKTLPPIALQILIENAIKHNVISAEEPLRIKIYNEGSQLLVVENNFNPKITVGESTGKGLRNISDRYHLLSNKDISIHCTDQHFIVKIPLLS